MKKTVFHIAIVLILMWFFPIIKWAVVIGIAILAIGIAIVNNKIKGFKYKL